MGPSLYLVLISSSVLLIAQASAQQAHGNVPSGELNNPPQAAESHTSVIIGGGLSTTRDDAGVDASFASSLYADSLLFLGLGIGWRKVQEYSWISPHISFRIMLLPGGISPLVFGEAGYSFGSYRKASDSDMDGLMLGIGGGFRIPIGSSLNVLPKLGFRVQKGEGIFGRRNFHGLIFNAGLSVKHSIHYSYGYGGPKSPPVLSEKSLLSVRWGLAFWEDELGPSLAFIPTMVLDPRMTAGIGVGLEKFEHNSFVSLFANMKGKVYEAGTTPVLFGELGYALERVDGVSTKDTRGLMLALGAGAEFPIDHRFTFSIDLSYKMMNSSRYVVYIPGGGIARENVSFDTFRINGGFLFL